MENMTSTKSQIEKKIRDALDIDFLEVINESSKHNVPPGSESHFKLVIVSPEFRECSLIDRHRQINALLADELAQGVHALSLNTLAPEEWERKNQTVQNTPPCLGGSKG